MVFLSGEWNNLSEKVKGQVNEISFQKAKAQSYDEQFDVLMMSEVIYNQANYEKIAQLIVKLMKQDGICLLANKLYYFGVGGSMPEFKQFLAANYATVLAFESLEVVNNKKGNKREIISVKKLI